MGPGTRPRYFLRCALISRDWTEVSLLDWIRAERAEGFRPKLSLDDPAYMTTPATGGFFNSAGVSGTITTDGGEPPRR